MWLQTLHWSIVIATTNDPLRLIHVIRTSKRKKEARSPKQQRDAAKKS